MCTPSSVHKVYLQIVRVHEVCPESVSTKCVQNWVQVNHNVCPTSLPTNGVHNVCSQIACVQKSLSTTCVNRLFVSTKCAYKVCPQSASTHVRIYTTKKQTKCAHQVLCTKCIHRFFASTKCVQKMRRLSVSIIGYS